MIRTTALITALLLAAPAMAADDTADFFSCAKPVWPQADLAAGNQGTVTLKFEIDADGKVLRSMVAKSSGHPALDEAAKEGITKCTFIPGTLNGKPVRSAMQMQYVWTLK
jgi:TonB family protein